MGVLTVAGLTLLFASNSPALHSLYTTIQHPPPAALLNAGAGVVAAVGMLSLGDFFNSLAPCPVIVKVRHPETLTARGRSECYIYLGAHTSPRGGLGEW